MTSIKGLSDCETVAEINSHYSQTSIRQPTYIEWPVIIEVLKLLSVKYCKQNPYQLRLPLAAMVMF